MELEDISANKRKINYKKGMRPKISHFWSPKESSYGLGGKKRERKKGKEEKEEEEEEEAKKGMELYGTCIELWFCMESCVFWTLVGISMVSKPRV